MRLYTGDVAFLRLKKKYAIESAIKKKKKLVIKGGPKRVLKAPVIKEKPLPPLRDLQRKYKDFKAHSEIYDEALKAYTYVGHVLNAREVLEATGGSFTPSGDSNFSEYKNWSSETMRAKVADVRGSDHGNYLRVTPEYVETIVDLPGLSINIGYSPDLASAGAQKAAAGIIRQYFPGFTLPSEFTHTDSIGTYKKFKANMEDLEILYSLERLTTIKPRFTDSYITAGKSTWNGPEQFKLPQGYAKKGFGQIAFLRMKVEGSNAEITNGYSVHGTRPGDTGMLADHNAKIEIPVSFQIVMRWPMEFCLYATSGENRKDFVPFLFWQYVSWHRAAYGSKRLKSGTKIKGPTRLNHLGKVLEMIEAEKSEGRKVKPRVNEDNFTIIGAAEQSMTGTVVWIPPKANMVADYINVIRASHNTETNKISLADAGVLADKPLLTDWHNEKMSWVRESGLGVSGGSDASGVQTIDLVGSKALDPVTIWKKMHVRLFTADENMGGGFQALWTILTKFSSGELGAQPNTNYFSISNLSQDPLLVSMVQRLQHAEAWPKLLIAARPDLGILTWESIGNPDSFGPDLDDPDLKTVDRDTVRVVRAMLRQIHTMCEDLLDKWDQIKGVAYSSRAHFLRFYLYLCTKYGEKSGEYRKAFNDAQKINTSKGLSNKDVSKVVLPNLPGVTTMMPHQVETANDLDEGGPHALMDVSMGGGKTLLGLQDALNKIYKKTAKRVLFIVPNNLVRNWIDEVMKFTKGTVNPWAITLNSVRRLQGVIEQDEFKRPNYAMLKKIIETCPPNTVFITTYNFLRSDNENIVYGNQDIQRLYAAEFFRDMGFDLVTLDESHFAKNLGASKTVGSSIVVSNAKATRMMSGTLVSNTLTDLVGQVAQSNPAALGTRLEFNTRYGDGSAQTVQQWQDGAELRVTQDIKPYVQRVTHKRQRWAFALPDMIEQFHPVMMTERQQEFYQQQLEEVLADIVRNDPKLARMLQDGNESDQAAIIKGLQIHFQKIEEFVYAPDSNAAFANQEDIEPDDLITPKMEMVVKLLEQHFDGYTDDDGSTYGPSKHKVIIFSHRRATSIHMMKHLPARWRKLAVHYQAGNEKALEQFRTSSEKMILVGDEKSINTGQNLQQASRMIRLETLWQPGEQDQAIARIWRPDFKDLSGRPHVYMDWIFTNGTLEVAKIGRLISKIVSNKKFERAEEESFTKQPFNITPAEISTVRRRFGVSVPMLDQRVPVDTILTAMKLPLIKMNLQTLRNTFNVQQLGEYFAAYYVTNLWEDKEFVASKARGDQALIEVPETARVMIPGSKKLAYIPRVPGVDPSVFDPRNRFGYKPVSVIESEMESAIDTDLETDLEEGRSREEVDDEREERYRQVNPVTENDLLDTEFGFGYMTKELDNDLWVEIKGVGEVKVPKASCWIVTNPKAVAQVNAALKAAGKRGLPRLPGVLREDVEVKISDSFKETPKKTPGVVRLPKKVEPVSSPRGGGAGNPKLIKPPPGKPKKVEYLDDEEDVVDDDDAIDLFGEIIDGQIGLTCFAEDNDSDVLQESHEFKLIDDYYAVKITTSAGLQNILLWMQKKFTIQDRFIENFRMYMQLMRSKQLNAFSPSMFQDTLRFFNIDSHKQLKEGELRPFPIVWGGSLFVGVTKNRTPSAAKFVRLVRGAALNGVKMLKEPLQSGLHVRLFRNKRDALEALDDIAGEVTISNKAEVLDWLKTVRATKAQAEPEPTRNAKKPAPKSTQLRSVKKPAASAAKPGKPADKKKQPPLRLPPAKRK